MRSYWIWFLALALAWTFALLHEYTVATVVMPWRLLFCAAFFAVFFLAPLLRQKRRRLTAILCLAAIFAILALWPDKGSTPNPYALLIFSILAGKAVYRLPLRYALSIGLLLFVGLLAPVFLGYPTFPPMFLVLYTGLLGLAYTVFRKSQDIAEEALARSAALLSEYRRLKRRSATDEEQTRQEERTQIARDIHDSVGHKLTALLIQLEIFRMKVGDEAGDPLRELKTLAKDSLEETRRAVKTLGQHEIGGLPAILRLIRKLEAESFIRIQISVKHGALSTPLSNEQSIAVYRAVQEALTNSMRHSGAREAELLFEVPGGSIFRFEVSHPIKEIVPYQEGFGLAAMRERIEQAGGRLEIVQSDGRFVVRGTFSLLQKEHMPHDSHSAG